MKNDAEKNWMSEDSKDSSEDSEDLSEDSEGLEKKQKNVQPRGNVMYICYREDRMLRLGPKQAYGR